MRSKHRASHDTTPLEKRGLNALLKDRKATVTQITTLYNCDEQKNNPEHTL